MRDAPERETLGSLFPITSSRKMKCPSLKTTMSGLLGFPHELASTLPLWLHFCHSLTPTLCSTIARIPFFFHTSVPLLTLFPPTRLPFSTFFSKTLPTYSLRLCIDTISSRECSLLPPAPPPISAGFPLLGYLPPHEERDHVPVSFPWAGWSHCMLTIVSVSPVTQCSVLTTVLQRVITKAELSWGQSWTLLIN